MRLFPGDLVFECDAVLSMNFNCPCRSIFALVKPSSIFECGSTLDIESAVEDCFVCQWFSLRISSCFAAFLKKKLFNLRNVCKAMLTVGIVEALFAKWLLIEKSIVVSKKLAFSKCRQPCCLTTRNSCLRTIIASYHKSSKCFSTKSFKEKTCIVEASLLK